ncbi:TIGR02466 family protein [Pseudomonas asplenii]|uniref:TIGR02466 family protein n=1 Tax=Pseudomonas asplenii TaxID=53407 RepID=UPI0037C6A1AB
MSYCVKVDPGEIKISRLFPTPIAALRHPQFESLNAQLLPIILERAAQRASVQHSNQGGWQSRDDFAQWAGEAGEALLAFAHNMADQLSAVNSPEHGLVEAELSWLVSAWANINHKGHANRLHGHPGSYWSAVYWVDDGGRDGDADLGGELEFFDPRGVAPSLVNPALRMRIEGCLDAGFMSVVPPQSGTLLMFPSWLLHSVSTYHGERPRVSVAFNFSA